MRCLPSVVAAAAGLFALPAQADVVTNTEAGFVLRQAADVTAGPDAVWAQLVKPSGWWSGQHSYSGDAANLSLDPRAGGCFCETLPSPSSPRAAPRGSVEHMRVIYAEQGKALRLSGALGPLQADALAGTLTVALKPIDGGGTRIMWEYVVGGFMRQWSGQTAPTVDKMLGEQIARLAAKLGPKPVAPPAPRNDGQTGR